MKGAQSAGHHADKIRLKDVNISYCTGCGVCFEGAKPCPQKDDMPGVLKQMIAADVIVMATPVYFFTMCAQMKTLIDRTCSRYTEIKDKDFYFIVTAAVSDTQSLDRTVEEFRGFTSCLDGAKEKGVVYGTGAWKIGDISASKAMQQAHEMGKTV